MAGWRWCKGKLLLRARAASPRSGGGLAEGRLRAGLHEIPFGRGLPPGTYVVRLTDGAETATHRLVLLR